jgi:nucleoside-diphosphate-sugar epimerase
MLLALTGATGFIGQHLLRELPQRGFRLRVLLRRPAPVPMQSGSAVIGDLARPRNMSAALEGVDAVIHSAGFTHGMSGIPEDDYRLLNTEATINLARAARRAGAKRFVFLSSIRAQCGPTAETVLTEADEPKPSDAYGRSKLAAERGLAELDLDWVSLRAALVYGPGVKGNIAQLMRLAQSPFPLPLRSIGGRRSLLALDNLSAAIETVLKAAGPLRRAFITADCEALTVAEMIAAMRAGLGRRPNVVPLPAALLKLLLRTTGHEEVYRRLFGSLVASPSALIGLGWKPPLTTAAGLRGLMQASAALAVWLFVAPPVLGVFGTVTSTSTSFISFVSPAMSQPATLTKSQSEALNSYDDAVNHFKSMLSERRAQIDSHQPLPNLPGQALYLARNAMISAYKDLTDVLPSKIGRPNRFGIPPSYFDADNEPLLDEYANLFKIMQAPPPNAQDSDTPFKDVVELGAAIGRAKGLDATNAEIAGRISLGLFFAETNGIQNIGNARSNTYKGSLQTGPSEDQNGQKKWAAIRKSIAAFDPALIARDHKEEERAGQMDHRYNHWTAVRDGLMNAHAELFPQIPAVVKSVPDPIDQMKIFELIQIIPSPTKSALNSGNLAAQTVSDPTVMGYLRNNSIFTFGRADREKTSATFRQILDAMWLFNDKFERALSQFKEIKADGGRAN